MATAPKAPAAPKGLKAFWLKCRAYISETERINAGLYVVDVVPERLLKADNSVVEIFEGEIPAKRLAEIAKWAGVNPDGQKEEEILALVAKTELNPF